MRKTRAQLLKENADLRNQIGGGTNITNCHFEGASEKRCEAITELAIAIQAVAKAFVGAPLLQVNTNDIPEEV